MGDNSERRREKRTPEIILDAHGSRRDQRRR